MDKNKKLFPQRLWELIHDEKYNFCLRWSPDGQRVYLNRNDFETHYLKTPNNQFHTQKAISFVRQMNMYGFKKVDDCYYENDNFKKNCHHLLKNMVRRNSNKSTCLIGDPISMNIDSDEMEQIPTNEHQMIVDQSSNQQTLAQLNQIHHHHHHHHQQQQQQQQQQEHQRASLLAHSNGRQPQQQLSNRQLSSRTFAPLQLTSQLQQQSQQHQRNLSSPQQTVIGQHEMNLSMNGTTTPVMPDTDANMALLSAMGAVMAALGSNNSTAQIPLASTLYHRLAALSFAQDNGDNAMNLSMDQQQREQINTLSANELDDALHASAVNGNLFFPAPRALPANNFNVSDIPMSQQNSLAARQAVQQTLIRSLLQLRQLVPNFLNQSNQNQWNN